MALKIGSIVRIKNFEYCNYKFRYMSDHMKKYCGEIGTIVRVEPRSADVSNYADKYGYYISFNNEGDWWIWSIDCLEILQHPTLMETE